MNRKQIFRYALVKATPILCSYLFVSMAYGILMAEAGFPWFDALLVSLTVYTGAFQFVLTSLQSSGASLVTIAVTALFMNSRQAFYSLSFVGDFQQMGRREPYMIHTMTDETYAVNCTLSLPDGDRREVMFWVAVFSRCSWMLGAVLGGALGELLPAVPQGIDFCMTALFVIIFMDQWEQARSHGPAVIGLSIGVVCLLVFGENQFILPALLIVSALLVLLQRQAEKGDEEG